MKIYHYDNGTKEELYDIPITKAAEHEEELMKSDFIKLSWDDAEYYTLPVDAFVEYGDEEYRLFEPYEPECKSEAHWHYEPHFHHPKMYAGKVPFVRPSTDSGGNSISLIDWSYTGFIATLLSDVCSQLDGVYGLASNTFAASISEGINNTISITFSSVDILSALTAMASQLECEWHIDWSSKILYFGHISILHSELTPMTLTVGENIQIPAVRSSKDGFWNAFEPQGSTRNITRRAASGEYVQSDVRLSLRKYDTEHYSPDGKYPDGVIYTDDSGTVISELPEGSREYRKTLIFEHVFPKLDLYVYDVKYRERYLKDENGERVISYYDTNNNPVYKKYAVWYMRLAYPNSYANPTQWTDYAIEDRKDCFFTVASKTTVNGFPSFVTDVNFSASIFITPISVQSQSGVTNYFRVKVKKDNLEVYGYVTNGSPCTVVLMNPGIDQSPSQEATAFYDAISVNDKVLVIEGIDKNQFPVSNTDEYSDIIDGKTLYCQFKANTAQGAMTSPLAGRGTGDNGNYGFALRYLGREGQDYITEANETPTEDGDTGIINAATGNSAQVTAKDYEIIFQEEGDYILPTTLTQGLIPKGVANKDTRPSETLKGNIVNLYNIVMGDEYEEAAKVELEDETKKYIANLFTDNNTYTFKSNPVAFKEMFDDDEDNNTDSHPYIGQRVLFVNDSRYVSESPLDTRIMKIVTKLDYDFEAEITIGNEVLKGNQQTLKEKVDTLISGGAGGSGGGGGSVSENAIQNIVKNWTTPRFLSKTNDDTAQGLIGFVKGLWVKAKNLFGIDANGNAKLNNITASQLIANVLKTPGFAEAAGMIGNGFGVTMRQDGTAMLQTDDLLVLGRMLVNSLNIREVTYIGGVYLLTPAGSTVAAVLPIYGESADTADTRFWTTDSDNLSNPVEVGYRLLWLADDGTTATMNFWQQGDQAYSQTFNIKAGEHENVTNSLWWRLVVGVGTDDDPLGDGKEYHYADVADTDIVLLFDSEGEPVTGDGGSLSFIGKGSSYAYVSNGLTHYTVPTVGDKAVCLGSQTSNNRRGAIQLNTEGVASIGIYDGINNYAPLSTHEVHFFSKDAVRMSSRRFRWTTATGASTPPIIYRGDWAPVNGVNPTSYYYDEWDYQGSRWLCLYQGAEGITCAPGEMPSNAPQGATVADYWKQISLKGDSEVTVYTRGATKPSAPIGSNIPPNGWSTDPTRAIYGVVAGESIDDNFVRHTIHFTTTQAAQTIDVWFIASSEANYDFIICGEVDQSVTSRPAGIGGTSAAAKAVQAQYHAVSGRNDKSFHLQAGQAGEHTLDVCFTKDGSSEDDEDCGYYRITGANFESEQLPIWASVATFNGDTKISGWSTPVRWNGEDGQNGTDGASPIIADLDNEMDSVVCDAGDDTAYGGQVCTTIASMLEGTTRKAFTLVEVKEWNEEDEEYVAVNVSGGTIAGDVTIEWSDNADNSKTVTFTFASAVSINGRREFVIVMRTGNVVREAVFTIAGLRPGADGSPATIYNILPSLDKITFARDANGGLTPSSRLLSFMVRKAVGGNITDILSGQMYSSDKLRLTYSVSEPPSSYNSNQLWPVSSAKEDTDANISFNAYGTATIPNSVAFSSLYLALFKEITNGNSTSYTLLDRETIPVIKDGQDGDDGEPGADAWTLTVNPSPIIIEQDIETPSSFGLPINISFSAKCGDNTATVGTIKSGDVSNNLGLTITRETSGTDYNNGVRLQITGYNKNSQTGKYVTNGYIDCTVPLSYGSGATARSTSMAVRIQVGVNLLGTWTQEIKDGVETSVSENIGHAIDPSGNIETTQQIGTYIRGWAENSAKLTETVSANSICNEKNLFGFSKGIIFNGIGVDAIPFVQGYGFAVVNTYNGRTVGRARNLGFDGKTGYYVVTCEIKMPSLGNDVTAAININLCDVDPESGTIDNNKRFMATNQWKKFTGVFNIPSSNPYVSANSLNGFFDVENFDSTYPTAQIIVRNLQIECGDTPSLFGICPADGSNDYTKVTDNFVLTDSNVAEKGNDSSIMLEDMEYFKNKQTGNAASNWHISGSTKFINICSSDPLSVYVENGCVYTLSFWAKASQNGMSIQSFLYASSGQTNIIDYVSGADYYDDEGQHAINGDGCTESYLTTAWRRFYIHWYVDKATGYRSLIAARLWGNKAENLSGYVYICGIRFDRGYVSSANRTEYQTVMHQTARTIDFSVLVNSMEKAGIHLYTTNKTTPDNEKELATGVIDLVAGKVNFVDPDGNPYTTPKVSIDPRTGTLKAINGEFEGKVTATSGSFTGSLTLPADSGVFSYGGTDTTYGAFGLYMNSSLAISGQRTDYRNGGTTRGAVLRIEAARTNSSYRGIYCKGDAEVQGITQLLKASTSDSYNALIAEGITDKGELTVDGNFNANGQMILGVSILNTGSSVILPKCAKGRVMICPGATTVGKATGVTLRDSTGSTVNSLSPNGRPRIFVAYDTDKWQEFYTG